jgi:hypothetical protein
MEGCRPLVKLESHFLDSEHDLICLAKQDLEYGTLERFIEKKWSHIFSTKVPRDFIES